MGHEYNSLIELCGCLFYLVIENFRQKSVFGTSWSFIAYSMHHRSVQFSPQVPPFSLAKIGAKHKTLSPPL